MKKLPDGRSLVFLIIYIPDFQSFSEGVDANDEVVILNPFEDGILQISQARQGRNAQSIQIVSHGIPSSTRLEIAMLNRNSTHSSPLNRIFALS